MAVLGDIVLFKTKVPVTRADPKGQGTPGQAANISNVPAIVARVINAGTGRMALLVFSEPPFSAVALPFNSLDPKWETWEPLP